MRRVIYPLPHYAFIAWCSVKEGSTGTTLALLLCLITQRAPIRAQDVSEVAIITPSGIVCL
jgi:hypothetical protein